MTPIKCFMVEPTEFQWRLLRRYNSSTDATGHYHDAKTLIGKAPIIWGESGGRRVILGDDLPTEPHDDPRWPTVCPCGYTFVDTDHWQVFTDPIYTRQDTGEEVSLRKLPPGGMYWAWWFEDIPYLCGPDGKCLIVALPSDGGDDLWMVDGPCSNCPTPEDKKHRCWCRHGVPPNVTVDKNPEPGQTTCTAGAGSIGTKRWHGFLRQGYLVT